MKVTETKIPGVLIIEPDVFGDSRGWFMETYTKTKIVEATTAEYSGWPAEINEFTMLFFSGGSTEDYLDNVLVKTLLEEPLSPSIDGQYSSLGRKVTVGQY